MALWLVVVAGDTRQMPFLWRRRHLELSICASPIRPTVRNCRDKTFKSAEKNWSDVGKTRQSSPVSSLLRFRCHRRRCCAACRSRIAASQILGWGEPRTGARRRPVATRSPGVASSTHSGDGPAARTLRIVRSAPRTPSSADPRLLGYRAGTPAGSGRR
jgi:hypothetical protein